MKLVYCYVPDCTNWVRWPWWAWLWGCIYTRSSHPFVCEEHAGMFDGC